MTVIINMVEYRVTEIHQVFKRKIMVNVTVVRLPYDVKPNEYTIILFTVYI